MDMMSKKSSADYDGFSLVSGGLIYSLTSVIRKKARPGKVLTTTAIVMVLITWAPLCVMALFEGTLNDDDTTISFFEDFLVHVRFLLVVPFLFLIENMVDRTFVDYIKNTDDIIPNSQQTIFNKLVKQLNKMTDSFIPEILVLLIYFSGVIFGSQVMTAIESGRNYVTYAGSDTLNIAGWYYLLICLPIFQLLVFRWLWRWIIWMYSIFRIYKLKLDINPLHADQMAGLEYLNLVPITFSFILVAPSALLSAIIGMDIIYNGVSLTVYYMPILIYVFLLPVALYFPLLIFIPKLFHARKEGILKFGDLIRKHNNDYTEKWILAKPSKKQPILGSVDNSSLSDINGSYASVQGTKMLPVDYKMIAISFLLNVIPYIPLVFTYYSISELFKLILKSVVG